MKKTFFVKGMHCTSCEILLEKNLKEIEGIKNIKVSHKKGIVEIDLLKADQEKNVIKIIEDGGFKIGQGSSSKSENKNTWKDYLQMVALFFVFMLLLRLFKNFELSSFFPNFNEQVGVMIALVLGLVASVSTCLALVGGIVISFGGTYHTEEDKEHSFLSRAIPHFYFHLGRVGGFALLGGLLGLLGSKLNYSLSFTGYLTILIGIVMFYIGLQILNIVPNITKLGFHLPKFLSKKIHSIGGDSHHFAPIFIGVLTFFLPCGFTQTMQLAAVSSQSFFTGALIMGAFALGTLPVLISIGIGSTYAQESKFDFTKKMLGMVVLLFALYSLNSGLVLSGVTISLKPLHQNIDQKQEDTQVVTNQDVQIVKMDVDWNFKPSQFQIKKGVPVRWEIRGVNVSGCSNEVVIPKFNLRKKIKQGEISIIEFTPTETGNLPFSCWMGMLHGSFTVID